MLLTKISGEPETIMDVLKTLYSNPNVDWGIVWFMISVYLVLFGVTSWVINGVLSQVNKRED